MIRHLCVAIVVIAAALGAPSAARAHDCPPTAIITGCGTQTAKDFRGTIIVPGSEAANRAVARNHGCDGCVWTLVPSCDRNTVDSPSYINCSAAHCPDGGIAYDIYLQRPTDTVPVDLDTTCLSPTRRVVTVADLAADLERYLTDLSPPRTTITTQPDARAVTGLATYFIATGPAHDSTTLDVDTAAGLARLTLDIAPDRFVWTFGDGTTCTTTAPGERYDGGTPAERCDTAVAHVYADPATVAVSLRATWHGTYVFDVGYGPVGPLPIPGAGVAGPAATSTVTVREARAELIGG